MPSPKSTAPGQTGGKPCVRSSRPVRKQPTRPTAIPSTSGSTNRSPVATATPSRRLTHSTAMSAPDQPSDDRLSCNQAARVCPLARKSRRVLHPREQTAAGEAADRSGDDDPPARSRIDDVSIAATLPAVPCEGERIGERLEHPMRVQRDRPDHRSRQESYSSRSEQAAHYNPVRSSHLNSANGRDLFARFGISPGPVHGGPVSRSSASLARCLVSASVTWGRA